MIYFSSGVLRSLISVALIAAAGCAHAELYQRVDPVSGHVTFTNIPPADAKPAVAQVTSVSTAVPSSPKRPAKSHSNDATPVQFPRVTAQQQKDRDADRRQILSDELRAETAALKKALERKASAEVLNRHRSNLTSLEREIASVK